MECPECRCSVLPPDVDCPACGGAIPFGVRRATDPRVGYVLFGYAVWTILMLFVVVFHLVSVFKVGFDAEVAVLLEVVLVIYLVAGIVGGVVAAKLEE